MDTPTLNSHYKKLAIEPIRYAYENNLNPLQTKVVKYVTRYKDKNGVEDLNKAIDMLRKLIAIEESVEDWWNV